MVTAYPRRMINFLALVLLSFRPARLFAVGIRGAIARRVAGQQHRTQEIGVWYNLLLSWPVLVTCFIINVRLRLRAAETSRQ